jgi:hypothetical protein
MTFRYAAKRVAIIAILLAVGLATQWISAAAADDNRNFKRRPTVCTEQYAPVCGELNGVSKTYSNACFAAADGAKIIAQGPCR